MVMDNEQKKIKYFINKEKLNIIRDNVTLKRWKILSRAYKQGREIWGSHFTRVRLAKDMELPITTVLRCLSLDRCNPTTWELIKAKKVSAFKVAQICMSKNRTYQDEIVQMVIKDDLTSYQITSLKVKKVDDLNTERLRVACKEGFSRQESAYKGFRNWINRGRLFMAMGKDKIPKDKLPLLKKELQQLIKTIEVYSNEL